jgi:HEAT repeat protein
VASGETRAASAWTLGRLHEGKADEELVTLLEAPLIPVPSMTPDDERLRYAAAVALGRLRAQHAVMVLTNAAGVGPTTDRIENACRWAIASITGDPLPPPGIVEAAQRDWFLVPTR